MTSHAGTTSDVSTTDVAQKKPWYTVLYVQVLIAILLGAVVGWLWPAFATNDWIKPLGDGFIKLIKMVIAPIIFCTVVFGIAHMQDVKKVGRIGIKALIYFEVVSTLALVIGLVVGNLVKPGAGITSMRHGRCGESRRLCQAGQGPEERRFLPAHHPRHAWSAPSPRARSCRYCCSRCCSALP